MNSELRKSSKEDDSLKSLYLKWAYHARPLLNSINSAWRILPSGGWALVGVGLNEGERDASLRTESGTWTSSMDRGQKLEGSYGLGEIISGVKTRVFDSGGLGKCEMETIGRGEDISEEATIEESILLAALFLLDEALVTLLGSGETMGGASGDH